MNTFNLNFGQENTDKEIWRENPGDYYSDSIHVTESGGIGMNYKGYVIVAPIKKWVKAVNLIYNSESRNVSKWRMKLALWLLKSDKPIVYKKQ